MRILGIASLVLLAACNTEGASDGGLDAPADGGSNDGGTRDAGSSDGGSEDGGSEDAGSGDSGSGDSGIVDPGAAYGMPTSLGALSGVPETSGIVASRRHANTFWVHNDSSHPEEVFAIDSGAAIRATITVTGATNQDWEDITLVPDPTGDFLIVGDHGDNLARTSGGAMSSRPGYFRVYRLREPDPAAGSATVAAEEIRLAYPDGPHDCEAMFADPRTGDLYFVSKVDSGPAGLYVARAPLAGPGPIMLESLRTLDFLSATAGDISADGSRIALRNYGMIRVYPVTAGIAAAFDATPIRPMNDAAPAEAITFGRGSYDLFTIAEGLGAQLFQIPWE